MSITLRDAGPDDGTFLLTVYAAARAAELAQTPWTTEQREAFVSMQFLAQDTFYHEHYPDADYKVIMREGEPVGRIYLTREPGLIEILDITVLTEFRNCGIGSNVMERVLDEGAKSGRNVQIYVESFNPSLELFKKMGFSSLQEEGINYLLEWNAAKAATETP